MHGVGVGVDFGDRDVAFPGDLFKHGTKRFARAHTPRNRRAPNPLQRLLRIGCEMETTSPGSAHPSSSGKGPMRLVPVRSERSCGSVAPSMHGGRGHRALGAHRNLADLADSCREAVDAGSVAPMDVMDGNFVPNLTFGPPSSGASAPLWATVRPLTPI